MSYLDEQKLSDSEFGDRDVRDLGLIQLRNVQLDSRVSAVLSQKKLIVERSIKTGSSRANWSTQSLKDHSDKHAVWISSKSLVTHEKGIFLSGTVCTNYWHWLFEFLPRLQAISGLPAKFDDFPLAVSSLALSVPTTRESLEIYAPGRKIISLSDDSMHEFCELIWPRSTQGCVLDLRSGVEPRIDDSEYSKSSLEFLRLRFPVEDTKQFRKIYLKRRSGARVCRNIHDVENLLLDFEYETIYIEDLTLKGQARMMQESKVIVGPTGAAWSNLLWAQKGTKGVIWTPDSVGTDFVYSKLAREVNVNLTQIQYQTEGNKVHGDYVIDLSILTDALKRVED
jgi:capsular polysaccharide biosynthesis protein